MQHRLDDAMLGPGAKGQEWQLASGWISSIPAAIGAVRSPGAQGQE